jgi:hypothetical protein
MPPYDCKWFSATQPPPDRSWIGCLTLDNDNHLWTLPTDWLKQLLLSGSLPPFGQPFHQFAAASIGFDDFKQAEWLSALNHLLLSERPMEADCADTAPSSSCDRMQKFTCRSKDQNSSWAVNLRCLDQSLRVFSCSLTDTTQIRQNNDRFCRAISASAIALFDVDVSTNEMHFFANSDCADFLVRPAEEVSSIYIHIIMFEV